MRKRYLMVPAALLLSMSVTFSEELTFPMGMQLPTDSFTGAAYLAPMIRLDDVYHFPTTNNIIFEPGARSSWHSHGGMVILGTGGVGYYQEEGKPAQIIREGDVVECPEGVRHWHGAVPDSWFSQVVIFDSQYVPSEDALPDAPVTDTEYANLDVALCPPGVKHWHGGSADTEFAHIAVNTNPERTGLEWFDRISEEEYAALPTEKMEEAAE